MTRRRYVPRDLEIPESPSLAKSLFWGAVILAGLVGVLLFTYQVKRQMRPTQYEGKIVDKWAGYNHSELGSSPHFRLLVEKAGGQRSTVAVDREIYDRVKVGMWIRKTSKGIELSSLTALAPDELDLPSICKSGRGTLSPPPSLKAT